MSCVGHRPCPFTTSLWQMSEVSQPALLIAILIKGCPWLQCGPGYSSNQLELCTFRRNVWAVCCHMCSASLTDIPCGAHTSRSSCTRFFLWAYILMRKRCTYHMVSVRHGLHKAQTQPAQPNGEMSVRREWAWRHTSQGLSLAPRTSP